MNNHYFHRLMCAGAWAGAVVWFGNFLRALHKNGSHFDTAFPLFACGIFVAVAVCWTLNSENK